MVSSSKSYEFEGNDVEDAIKNAVSDLHVSRETINVKIVSEEQKGLFGMEGAIIESYRTGPDGIRFEAQGPGRAVVSSAYFPGWIVWRNGQRQKIELYEGIFPSIPLPEGRHIVKLASRPFSFRFGAIVAGLTAILLIVSRLFRRKRTFF